MLVVGLTGGIGSGKSTVAELFKKFDINIIDTDQLARNLTEPNLPAYQKILKKFGKNIIFSNGQLNRRLLRKMIFDDNTKRNWLEKLLHPLIKKEMKKQAQDADSPYTIVVVPLLFEKKWQSLFERTLVVDVPKNVQIKRVQKRDKHSADEIKAILDTQATRAQRLKLADDIIENTGSLYDLKAKVRHLHEFYLALASRTKNQKKFKTKRRTS